MPEMSRSDLVGRQVDTILGNVGFNPKGQYEARTSYDRLDVVQWGGKGWICLTDGTIGVEPVEGETWMQLANNGSEDLLEQTRQAMEAAKASQTAAKASQDAAAESATTAGEAAETATTKADEAAKSAKAAAGSANAAKVDAQNSFGSQQAAAQCQIQCMASEDAAIEAAERAEAAAETAAQDAAAAIQDHPPQINRDTNTWETYSVSQGEYVDTGMYAGVDLVAGNGVTIEKTEHGATIGLPVWLGFDDDTGKFCIYEEDEV